MCNVSVIIPTFNRLSCLKEALFSVIDQTLAPKEIIIVDDGSTDGTYEWFKSQNHNFVRVLRQDNFGPATARNLGVSHATGRWIAFLDSDDLWKPEKLNTQVKFLKHHPQFRICQTEEIWLRNGIRVNSKKHHQKHSGYIFEKCLPLCIISPSAVMMERDLFRDLEGFDETLPVCEDYELWLRVTLRSPVKTLPQPLTVKRGGHSDQLSKKYWGMDRFRVQALEKVLREETLTTGQRDAVLKEIRIKLTILAEGFSKRHPKKINPYQEKWQKLQKKYRNVSMVENPTSFAQ